MFVFGIVETRLCECTGVWLINPNKVNEVVLFAFPSLGGFCCSPLNNRVALIMRFVYLDR